MRTRGLLEACAQAFESVGETKAARKCRAGVRLMDMNKDLDYRSDEYDRISELTGWLLNDFAFERLNELTPEGYYWGSLEGDGACIGVFAELS